jgi:hypothetical protein
VDAKEQLAEYERRHRLGEPTDRSPPIDVEATFDAFVSEFGGQKVSAILENKAQLPLNADYFFPEQNAIAELKTIEGAYSGPNGVRAFLQALIDSGVPENLRFRVALGLEPLDEAARDKIRKRMRRSLEERIKKARKQLRMSKSMIGDEGTISILILAMNEQPMFGHGFLLATLTSVMASNFSDEHIDAVVYINPNTPTRVRRDGMEFSGWHPFYRDDEVNERVAGVIDLIGNRWLRFKAKATGSENPILVLGGEDAVESLFFSDREAETRSDLV